MTVYLTVTRFANLRNTGILDFVALVVACGLGAVCLWQLVKHRKWRIVALLGYVVAMGTLKFLHTFAFACTVFSDCL